MELGFFFWLAAFLAVSVLVTFLIKKFTKNDTHFIISLIRTQKPLMFFDEMAGHKKFLDIFSELGLFLGFGAIAIDFWHGRKLSMPKRIALFIASFAILSGLMFLIDFFLGNSLSKSPIAGPTFPLMVASFGLMGFAGFTLFSLVLQGFDIASKYFVGVKACPGVAPLVPGVEIPGVPITPPLHAWISLIIILVVHEAMHGILGRRHGFRIKSAGALLFGFLPVGAFVEPDEKQVSEEKDEKVLPFLAAGPMANLALMLIAGIILLGVVAAVNPLTDALYPGVRDSLFSGVKVHSVLEKTSFCGVDYPSSAFGQFMPGDTIEEVNGVEIKNLGVLFAELQKNRFSEKTFSIDRNGTAILMTLKPNSFGQFGFRPEQLPNTEFSAPESFFSYVETIDLVVSFIYWLVLLNFLVATINFLPMHPFDGGRMARILFVPYLSFLNRPREETMKVITKVFMAGILFLLIVNALPLFI